MKNHFLLMEYKLIKLLIEACDPLNHSCYKTASLPVWYMLLLAALTQLTGAAGVCPQRSREEMWRISSHEITPVLHQPTLYNC